MLSKVNSCAVVGLTCVPVEVEVDLSKGFPNFGIVGLADAAIKEAKERIRLALKNSDIPFPYTRRITVNLAPADLPKRGPSYDLPMVLGLLLDILDIPFSVQDSLFIGEISFDGSLRHIDGVLSMALYAREHGYNTLFLPAADAAEAQLVKGLSLVPLVHIRELIDGILGRAPFPCLESAGIPLNIQAPVFDYDMANIRGQMQAKRALEIAAAGGHNVLFSGPPGAGKTLLARTFASILPSMIEQEILEVTQIYSAAGMLAQGQPIISHRPFRAPHHSASGAALVGGGKIPKPGEITLAHRGVLFLDEFPEFARSTLEHLRQPLEDGVIAIARAHGTVTFPARFILVASQNPCPCGYASHPKRECTCAESEIRLYQRKISGPILDRMDMFIEVPPVESKSLTDNTPAESSFAIRGRVEQARCKQNSRFQQSKTVWNGEMNGKEIKEHCAADARAKQILEQALDRFHLSARSYFRILKVARTIADLEECASIESRHIAEALQFRAKDLTGYGK